MTGYHIMRTVICLIFCSLLSVKIGFISPPPPLHSFNIVYFFCFFFPTAIEVFHLVRKFLFIFQLKDDEKVFHLVCLPIFYPNTLSIFVLLFSMKIGKLVEML